MPVVIRYGIATLLALIMTFLLVYSMQYLITSSERSLNDDEAGYIVDFIRLKREEVIKRKQYKPQKPAQPKVPPVVPPPPQVNFQKPAAEKIAVVSIPVSNEISMTAGGISLSPGDAEYLPIVKIAPVYPRRALQRGIQGYVIVEFSVTRQGTTKDIKVIESVPETTIFHRAAIKAAAKFKYKPRTEDGKAIAVTGVRNKIIFRMAK